jgi:effector-binding domain-containing protein
MDLTEVPEIVNWPQTYYVFVEKVGPFPMSALQAWGEAHALVPELSQHNRVAGKMSLYKIWSKTYRAGFVLEAPPSEQPKGLKYEIFEGGKYSKFTLSGPYSELPQASGRVIELVEEQGIETREDWTIENYVTDPRTTPAEKLVTEILVPTK